jgi:carbamoyl-phosphate synthase large subunit
MNVLISSAGRRVGLLRCFRQALKDSGKAGRVLAVDSSPYSAALQDADRGWVVPRCTDSAFIPTMLDLCEREQVQLVVPTIDTELESYARHRAAFAELGTIVAVSGPETIRIAGDKQQTNHHFDVNGIPTARQFANAEDWASASRVLRFPVVAKPRNGSAGIGVRTVPDAESLRPIWSAEPDLIVEELLQGDEYTVNAYVNGLGECTAQVPHVRMEVRAGEVSKGVTVRNLALMDLARKAVESLPNAFGPLCLQGKVDPESQVIHFFEINARFGGGYPLAHAAGANFAACLLREADGDPVREPTTDWTDGLAMLRFDEPIFLTAIDIEERALWSPSR